MPPGFIYAFGYDTPKNVPEIPILKIGKTRNTPEERLYQAHSELRNLKKKTYVMDLPLKIVGYVKVDNIDLYEEEIHKLLHSRRLGNREWFAIDKDATNKIFSEVGKKPLREVKLDRIFSRAKSYNYIYDIAFLIFIFLFPFIVLNI